VLSMQGNDATEGRGTGGAGCAESTRLGAVVVEAGRADRGPLSIDGNHGSRRPGDRHGGDVSRLPTELSAYPPEKFESNRRMRGVLERHATNTPLWRGQARVHLCHNPSRVGIECYTPG
jgi:hypothetical protein